MTGLELRGDDNRLLAANSAGVADFLPADSSGSGKARSLIDNRLGLFVNGSVKVGSKGRSKNSFAFDIKDTSITAGADYRVIDWFVVGAAYGSGRTRTLFKSDLGRLDLNANGGSVFAAAYGRSFYANVLAGYAAPCPHQSPLSALAGREPGRLPREPTQLPRVPPLSTGLKRWGKRRNFPGWSILRRRFTGVPRGSKSEQAGYPLL